MEVLGKIVSSYWGMNYEMVNEEARLKTVWKPSIDQLAKDKVFIDLGCGTGVLGMYALEQGAKFVYFVERQDGMVALLKETLPQILPELNYKIIHKNIFDLTAEDFDIFVPEVVVSETIGVHIFDEQYINFCQHLKSLYQDLIFIPNFLEIEIRVAEIDYTKYPWPYNEPRLTEIYRSYYNKVKYFVYSGFKKNAPATIDLEKTKLIGSIFYDIEKNNLNLSCQFEINEEKECLIYCIGKVSQDLTNTEEWSYFGWYVNSNNSKGKYQVQFDIPTNRMHISRR